jgi:integrase
LTTPLHHELQELSESAAYADFINSIRSPQTKQVYIYSLKRYMRYLKLSSFDQLLHNDCTPKVIESQIIDYIMSLRQDGIAYATIKYLIAPIFTLYSLNDVVINRKKVARYLGEYKRVVKDSAYTTEQIQQALQTADSRMRCIILLLASTGCRIGALHSLTLGNLELLPIGLYKITFYESTNNEYYTFCTRECTTTGINNYIDYRRRCGEKLSFNEGTHRWEPAESPLIRLQFDATDTLQARHPKPIGYRGLKMALSTHLIRSGLRSAEHTTEHVKRIRKSIALTNGFRKFTNSTFVRAGLNHEIRELLSDHATQLDQSYFRPQKNRFSRNILRQNPIS